MKILYINSKQCWQYVAMVQIIQVRLLISDTFIRNSGKIGEYLNIQYKKKLKIFKIGKIFGSVLYFCVSNPFQDASEYLSYLSSINYFYYTFLSWSYLGFFA